MELSPDEFIAIKKVLSDELNQENYNIKEFKITLVLKALDELSQNDDYIDYNLEDIKLLGNNLTIFDPHKDNWEFFYIEPLSNIERIQITAIRENGNEE